MPSPLATASALLVDVSRTVLHLPSDDGLVVRIGISAALQHSGGKVFGAGGAAELLGMKPTTLASRIKALGIKSCA